MDPVYMMVQCYSFRPEFWSLDSEARGEFLLEADGLVREAAGEIPHFRMYRSLRNDMDIVLWYASRKPEQLADFKAGMLEITRGMVSNTYGSFSIYRESPYLKPGQDLMDTLKRDPLPYFVAYPMSKENSWYQIPYEERKQIMAEHIGVALAHPDNRNIRSYTTYSFGIADGEFMVIYEVDDFSRWSNVTAKLREVKARQWITNEVPIITGITTTSMKL